MVSVATGSTPLAVLAALVACDGGHPDTGYGERTPVPAQVTCLDACARIADCAVALCNEDTTSTRFSALEDAFVADCLAGCVDNLLAAQLPPPAWSCMFTESCRAVFEHDTCEIQGRYTCRE